MEKIITEKSLIHESSVMKNLKYGIYTEVGVNNVIENTYLGDYSYTGENVYIQNAVIGKFVNIAAMVRIGAPQHPMDRPALHHFTYRRKMYGFHEEDDADFFKWREEQKVIIGHDVWIGHGAVIQSGISIGNGAVIGSGAVVTKDVQPYTIVGGVPAKFIRERFSKGIVEKLQSIGWWHWSYIAIKENLQDFYLSVDDFVLKHYREGI